MRLLALLCLLLPASLAGQAHLEVRMLDVGQGDAVLLRHGGQAVLYDAGPVGSGVATRLGELGLDTLHLVVASHAHADHIGGLPPVFDSLAVRAFAWPGVDHGTQAFSRMASAVAREPDLSLGVLKRVGAMELRWLWPPADSTHWSLNDRSLGVRVCVLDGCIMLAGDAEEALWAYWLAAGQVESVQVHKSSHHGSANGDTAEGIEALSPELVLIGVGAGNRFDHPRQEALDLYEAVGARVLRTDLHGEIVVELGPEGELRTWVERPQVVHPPRIERWPWWPAVVW